MALKIRPYKLGSASANLLRDSISQLIGRKIWMSTDNDVLRKHIVINWGSGDAVRGLRIINSPDLVNVAIDKSRCFTRLDRNDVPEWTTSKDEAKRWALADPVYCRTITTGHEGRGIVIANSPEEVVNAPLYTARFKHSREYRVHVAFGNVIQVVQKKKREGVDANPMIRSNNNWVFARNFEERPEELRAVKEVALRGCAALGLDFGAFDILYSVRQNKAIILECNTAPGLDETSASVYAQSFVNELVRR